MSLLAVLYKLVPESPILVAFNKDEFIEKPQPKPTIQSGKPRVLASVHPQTGGTDLGVNQHGMFIGITSRRKSTNVYSPKSVDILVRTLLRAGSARRALDQAMEELGTGQYEGANLIIADYESGWIVHGGADLNARELEEGLSIVSDGDVDDSRDERVGLARRLLTLQMLDSPVKFLAVASKVFARSQSAPGRPSMALNEPNCKTVSSTLIALGKKPRDAIYQFAAGSPDRTKYEDYSPMLRDILSRGLRESRQRAKA